MSENDVCNGGNERIVLVQCTNSKRDEPARARDLYDVSDYFCKQREYAETRCDAWFIQSAEHGLLHPDTVVEPYNTRPRDLDDTDEWATHITEALGEWYPEGPVVVEILGGAAYADPLTPELERVGFEVHEPFRGLRIGERQSKLSEAVA